MPLVRISLMKDRPTGLGKKIGAIVYRTMVDTINVPLHDNFQVITEHDSDGLIYDPEYLNIPRTADVVFIQITLNEGRTVEMKKLFYQTLAARLNQELSLRQEAILVNLVEVKKENWSFGNGIAQYAQ
ncbi:MAG TPA: tautomerase family protein [Anaerolineales bacterium]|jgi:4-oxalocrotonate tautomerase|nr:tautomerase family protein [Anaerolineales bacterium]